MSRRTSALLAWLDAPPANIALIDAANGRSWSYAELAEAVRRILTTMAGPRKSLVACVCRPDATSVIGYLAALAAGHAVLLLGAEADPAATDAVLDRYRPEFVLRDGRCAASATSGAGAIHTDLAVLLSTSGVTGSSKLVRLSAGNLDANAEQIIEVLEIDSAERALLSLPFHHAYGLSVVNTHLRAGATIVLTPESVVRPEFWDVARQYDCTSFAGVPYAYEILAKIGFERFGLPALRTLTQAGGRMAPGRVLEFARLMRARGGRLVVMYGQTEATARIAYVPPTRVFDKPGSVGISVPRGTLTLAPDDELIFEGPNVMLGYASSRDDLARGDDQHGVLATGDLGRLDDDGYLSIVGRKRRIAKVCGQRVNLDELETLLAADGPLAALEVEGRLAIVRPRGSRRLGHADLTRSVALRLALPTMFIDVHDVDELPLTSSGKVDYPRITRELVAG